MSGETILVVDDNHQISDLMVGTFLPEMGYKTLVAYDGRSALKILRKHSRYINLMLLDLQLPDTNGLDMLRKLAKENINVPTILVTAHGSEQIAVDAFRLGVQDYLIKPVDADLLSVSIARALTETRLRQEKASLTSQLKKQVEWLTVLSNVGQSVISSLDLDEVLRRIVEAGVYLTQAEEGFLALLEDQGTRLYLRAVKNIDEDQSKTLRLPVNDSMVGSVLRTGRPLRLSREAEGPLLKVSTGFLVHSLIHVPILSRGNALGVLSVDNRTNRQAFNEIDDSMLTSLADYAAVAIENANLYRKARQEIDERMRVELALRESEERYALAMRGANDGLWDWNFKTNKIYFSPRWKAMLGYGENEIGDDPNEWFGRVHPDDISQLKTDISAHVKGMTSHFENEHRMLHKSGSYRWMRSRGLAVVDEKGLANRMAGSQTDITERKHAEQKLYYDAFHDSLTGLPNRALFTERLKYAIERRRRREDYLFAVLFLDLDRFKDINDSLGHMTGDKLLIGIAHMLGTHLRPTDTVARIGGDEFVILMEDINDASDVTRVADRVQKELTKSFRQIGNTSFVSASIGIVLSTTGYTRPEDILRDADIAMYRAKSMGRSRYEIFDPAMREQIMERLALEAELREALERQELRLYYQPILSLDNGEMIGLESLVRWQHPKRGLLYPIEFIPLAEETGLIIPLDRWVLREACRQFREWQTQAVTDPQLTISVNISGKNFTQADLPDLIAEMLHETGLDGRSLNLEVTESSIMADFELTAEIFKRLQILGVQMQIDDFGIGYSSLSCLARFPLNALKVDQTFVEMMAKDNNYLRIVQAIVVMTHGLGMQVIAEGVETEEQIGQLRSLGCEYMQGYIASQAIDHEAMGKLLGRIQAGEAVFNHRRIFRKQ